MLSADRSAPLDDGMGPETEAVAVVATSVSSQLPVDARGALADRVDGAAEAQPLVVRSPSAGSALADMVCWCAAAEARASVLITSCVERLPSVGRSAALEPELTVAVGASYPVSVPSTPVSAGRVVSGEGKDADVELVMTLSCVGTPDVLDAAGAAVLAADMADTAAVSAPSTSTVEVG
jgi:hypothetical protein